MPLLQSRGFIEIVRKVAAAFAVAASLVWLLVVGWFSLVSHEPKVYKFARAIKLARKVLFLVL